MFYAVTTSGLEVLMSNDEYGDDSDAESDTKLGAKEGAGECTGKWGHSLISLNLQPAKKLVSFPDHPKARWSGSVFFGIVRFWGDCQSDCRNARHANITCFMLGCT